MTLASKWLLPSALVLGLAGAGHAQVKLERKFVEDRKSTTEVTLKLQQTMTIQGNPIETQSETTVTIASAAGKRRDDGMLPINVTIDAVRSTVNLPNTTITFDSSAPAPKEEDPIAARLVNGFKALVGSSYTLMLDKQGQVASVEGTEKSIDRARELDPEVAEALQSQVNPEVLKKEFAEDLGQMPGKPVNKGETWMRTDAMNLGMGQTLTFDRTYEYLGTVMKDGKTYEKIGVKATGVKFAINNPSLPVAVDKSDLKVASSEGSLLFDAEAGEVVEKNIRTQLQGTMTLSAGGQTIPADLDLTIEEQEKVELGK